MTGSISNCNVEVHTGPSGDQVEAVLGLQSLMMMQLEVLNSAHSNLKGPTNVTGIKLEGTGHVSISDTSMTGAKTGVHFT